MDYVVRPGYIFRLPPGWPGMLANKRARLIVVSRDSFDAGEPSETDDLVTPVLRKALSFMGINDVGVVRDSGIQLGRRTSSGFDLQPFGHEPNLFRFLALPFVQPRKTKVFRNPRGVELPPPDHNFGRSWTKLDQVSMGIEMIHPPTY